MLPFLVKLHFYETLDPVTDWLKKIGAKYRNLAFGVIQVDAFPSGWEKVDNVWGPISEIRDSQGTVVADYNPIDQTLELMD